MTATGYVNDDVVTSVEGQSGDVDLDAADVGAEAAGTAASAVSTHAGAADPHGDRAFARGHDVASGETDYVNRPATGAEGEDVWQVQYAGARGLYANGYGCGRARVPNHADAAEQVAFRCQCHSSKDGTAQAIFQAALSDNTAQFETRANGDSVATRDVYVGRNLVLDGVTLSIDADWTELTLGTNISAGTAVAPGSRYELTRVYLRGQLAWTSQTLTGGTVLATLANEDHWPATRKTLSIRTSPSSNVSTLLHINPDGQITNEGNFGGSASTAYVSLDGMSYERE